jgi:small subunit ribosomal protein S2
LVIASVKDLLESGVHFGHRVSRWNPKMEQYIFGKRNLIHIINLRETLKGLFRAHNFLQKLCAEGKEVLIVGTKRQAKAVVEAEAKRCNMPYVTERWLGGTLTNFETITCRLERLHELEKMEETGESALLSKKELARFNREKRKLLRNLGGIRHMKRLPGAVIIVDPRREQNALKESYKLGLPTICLIDTDSDPELVDIPIPGNDDAMRSIQVILHRLTDAVIGGNKIARTHQGIDIKKMEEDRDAAEAASGKPKTFVVRRKDGGAPTPTPVATPTPEVPKADAPAPEAPPVETPAPEAAPAETPAAEAAPVETPAPEAAPAEAPASETPAPEATPAVETPPATEKPEETPETKPE